jgi:ketosteroid isomerase-like protein
MPEPTLSAAEVHRRLVDAWPDILAGDLAEPLTLIAPDVVDHRGGSSGDHTGRDAWRVKWEHMARNGFHDVSVTVAENVAAGETSANRYLSRGTHTESGKSYEVCGIDMIHVRDGRVVEHWAVLDANAVHHQLGF